MKTTLNQHDDAAHQKKFAEILKSIIKASDWYSTLADIRTLRLSDWWVAGGAVRNTVWQSLYGESCTLKIKDLDVVFYYKDSGREFEQKCKQALQSIHPQWVFDVKNQASFGVWRPWHFTFVDSTDGIAHFLHTATANGVRLNQAGEIEICAPYGLSDLLNGIIRTTPFRHREDAIQSKQNEYLTHCPGLTVAR